MSGSEAIPKQRPNRRLVCRRAIKVIVCLILLYPTINLIGLIPVNNHFKSVPNGVEIFITSSAVHADIVMPIKDETIDWRDRFPADCFTGDTGNATHIAIGWGDKGFFLETPTWADLRLSTAARALLWPTDGCMHVALTGEKFLGEDARSVRVSADEYQRLVDFILASFRVDEQGEIMQVKGYAYATNDAFFEALGTYHCLNTCNTWVGRAMRSAGIRTPWLTHLPKTVFLYLPDEPRSGS